jgi:2-amino-4-hydroxy-6-hydroxymethyldihydropteridine diphosphokinase
LGGFSTKEKIQAKDLFPLLPQFAGVYYLANLIVVAHIGLGSNEGNRRENLRQALGALAQADGITIAKVSSLYETAAIGNNARDDFLNAVAEIETQSGAEELLNLLNHIEKLLGRERKVKWGPRCIDLDILLFGPQVMMNEKLTIPHPEMVRRKFVLLPLVEIAPRTLHPVLGRTMREIWEEAGGEIKAQRVELREARGWHA